MTLAFHQTTLPVLDDLAARANEAHRKAEGAAVSALEYAREAGEHLAAAKAQCRHGEWLPWLEANFEGSRWTATNYMRLAERWDELNGEQVPHLTLRAALAELAEPRTPPDSQGMFESQAAEETQAETTTSAGFLQEGETTAEDHPEAMYCKYCRGDTRVEWHPDGSIIVCETCQHGLATREMVANNDYPGVAPEQPQPTGRPHLNVLSNADVEWYTPPEYIEAARDVLREINLDPASNPTAQSVILADRFHTKDDDGLTHDWAGKVWLNPPWGRACGQFVAKLVTHYQAGDVTEAIVLLNSNSNETEWFQPLWNHTLCFTRGRINYYTSTGEQENGSTHGSVFAYLGPNWREFAKRFAQYGNVVRRVTL